MSINDIECFPHKYIKIDYTDNYDGRNTTKKMYTIYCTRCGDVKYFKIDLKTYTVIKKDRH